MTESTTRAYAQSSYTIDLRGLAEHTRDTLCVYARDVGAALRGTRAELPRSSVDPGFRCQAEHNVPDSIRIR